MLVDQLGLTLGRAIELGRPFGEGALAVGDRRQPQGRHIVLDAHRRFEDRVGAEHVVVGEAEQLLAQPVAIAQAEIAHAADLVGRLAILDAAFGDRRMPVRQSVEVANAGPDAVGAGVDDAG